MNNPIPKRSYSLAELARFIIPSAIGVILFMLPVSWQGSTTIPVAMLAKSVQSVLSDWLPQIAFGLILVSFLGSLWAKLFRPSIIKEPGSMRDLFDVTGFWLIIRGIALLLAGATLFQLGPAFLWSEGTGQVLLYDLLPMLFSVFLLAGLLLPLLLNFGLLEFFGTLMTRIMRPIFTLPGRSSIDCVTSWLGDGTIGVLLTNKQYVEGYYSQREAAVIATTFSAVSITFSFVVLAQVELEHLFLPFYATVALAGIAAAVIMPRIPPLSRKKEVYEDGSADKVSEWIPAPYTPVRWGLKQAVKKAGENTGAGRFIGQGGKNILDLWIGVIPVVMAIGTAALIIAEYTPVFRWIGLPFIPILELLGVPEAREASQMMLIGFADMFLPTVLASSQIESPFTLFVIACLSVSQLIYMSEVGGLLLSSKIPVSFIELFVIFLLRTLISLPIIVLSAYLIF